MTNDIEIEIRRKLYTADELAQSTPSSLKYVFVSALAITKPFRHLLLVLKIPVEPPDGFRYAYTLTLEHAIAASLQILRHTNIQRCHSHCSPFKEYLQHTVLHYVMQYS